MTEIWKNYKTYMTKECNTIRTDIDVSNMGNVRGRIYNGIEFNESLIVNRESDGRRCLITFPIYQLVWKVFCGDPPNGYDIHHINHNKFDDRLENLELLEHGEHTSHHQTNRVRSDEELENQRISQTGKHKGELNGMYDKHHTEESKQKMKDAWKNRESVSDETKEKLSKVIIGRKWWTNGEIEIRSFNCPGENYLRGRLSNWYNLIKEYERPNGIS